VRLTTLLADPVYHLSLAHQNEGYNQPNHVGLYLGDGMAVPPKEAREPRTK